MASGWGTAWAAAWGDAWGTVDASAPPPAPPEQVLPFVGADDRPQEDTLSDDDLFYIASALITHGVLDT